MAAGGDPKYVLLRSSPTTPALPLTSWTLPFPKCQLCCGVPIWVPNPTSWYNTMKTSAKAFLGVVLLNQYLHKVKLISFIDENIEIQRSHRPNLRLNEPENDTERWRPTRCAYIQVWLDVLVSFSITPLFPAMSQGCSLHLEVFLPPASS